MSAKLLLTGRPGVGKTTLVRKVIAQVGERAGGFYTEEARDETGRRLGFHIATLEGERGWLARLDVRGKYRVGKYGVDVNALERLAISAVRAALAEREIILMDEIGPMEMLSPEFRKVVMQALASPKALLATIVTRAHPFADQVKATPGVRLIEVTVQNRDELPALIIKWLTQPELGSV